MDYTDPTRARFLALLVDVRNALGYSMRNETQQNEQELAMEMMYGGFDFAIVHSLVHKPDALLIECRFGPIPEGREFPIMKKLLHMNCALAEIDGSTFCIEPESGDLIYTIAQSLAALDGKSLLYKMTEIVWHGRRWLETRFVKEEGNRKNDSINPFSLA
jgi:hypothetical protein